MKKLLEGRIGRISMSIAGTVAIVAAWVAFSWPVGILPLVIFVLGSKAVEGLQSTAETGSPG